MANNHDMESFDVTVKTINFGYLARTLMTGTALIFAVAVGILQLILFLPIAVDLKAFVFASFGLFPSLLVIAGLAFLVMMLVMLLGGTKKVRGILRIAQDFRFESKHLKLSHGFSEIRRVYVPYYEGSFNEWMVLSDKGKFQLTFEHLAERLRAEELLKKHDIMVERKEL